MASCYIKLYVLWGHTRTNHQSIKMPDLTMSKNKQLLPYILIITFAHYTSKSKALDFLFKYNEMFIRTLMIYFLSRTQKGYFQLCLSAAYIWTFSSYKTIFSNSTYVFSHKSISEVVNSAIYFTTIKVEVGHDVRALIFRVSLHVPFYNIN